MDMKKILLLSAGVFAVLVVIFFVFIKPGKPELHPATIQAQQMEAKEQYEDALTLLMKHEKELDDEGKLLMEQIKTQIYPEKLEKAERMFNNEEYVLALENYQELLKIAPQDQSTDLVQENIKELEAMVEQIEILQKEYDKYMDTFKEALIGSNDFLKDFKEQLDQFEIGNLKAKAFANHFKDKVVSSNEVINTLDAAFSINNEELLDIHKDAINLMNDQHNMILTAMNANKKEIEREELINKFKNDFIQVKQSQITLIQKLNEFAENNHLEKVSISEIDRKNAEESLEDVEKNDDTDKKDVVEKEPKPAKQKEEPKKNGAEAPVKK